METLSILSRQLTDDELDYIIERAVAERDKQGSSMLGFADLRKLKFSLHQMDKQGRIRSFVNGQGKIIGILVFDVGFAWWSKSLILSETFVFCVDPEFHGFGRVAVKELKALASVYHCEIIVAGNFFMEKPDVMTNTYKKGGFETICPTYIKVVGGSNNG